MPSVTTERSSIALPGYEQVPTTTRVLIAIQSRRSDLMLRLARSLVTITCAALVVGAGVVPVAAAATPTRTVKVKMVDVAYEPSTVTATAGETVRFSFVNRGKAVHDAFVGTQAEQKQHEREMRAAEKDADGGHGGGHEGSESGKETKGLTLKPGKRGSLTYTFDQAGELQIGCHEPGHYKAGMVINVTVSDAPAS
jgi:uncharacterized cupredoxin-like copper-binding protein